MRCSAPLRTSESDRPRRPRNESLATFAELRLNGAGVPTRTSRNRLRCDVPGAEEASPPPVIDVRRRLVTNWRI